LKILKIIYLNGALSNQEVKLKWPCAMLIISVGFVLLGFFQCDKLFTDFGPQPILDDKNSYQPMLNVFGILRPDEQNGMPMSFVHLEESYSVYTSPDTLLIPDASVKIFTMENGTATDSVAFEFTSYNQLFETQSYRHQTFIPQPGSTYQVVCKKEGYPELTSRTTMPQLPRVLNLTTHLNEKRVTFSIVHDSLVGLYDCYLEVGEKVYTKPVRRSDEGNTDVQFQVDDFDDNDGALFIYAYDTKLSEYKTYNITIKPNSYRTDYSTVENGFGCFGSLNILGIPLSF